MRFMMRLIRLSLNALLHVYRTYGLSGFYLLGQFLLLRLFSKSEPALHDIRDYPDSKYKGKTTIIIPTRDGLEILRNCINSIFKYTPSSDFELLVINNGSVEPETLEYFAHLKNLENCRILDDAIDFNFSELNNSAVKVTTTEMLCFLNNDTEVLERGWLSELALRASGENIGAVGPLLLYPNGLIQHAGIVLRHRGIARNYLAKVSPTSEIGQNWLSRDRGVAAVTGACLVIEKSKFVSIGGFDPALPVGFNDVDLCIRLFEVGLMNIFTPFVKLIHYESMTRGTNYLKRLNGYIDDVIIMMKKLNF